MENETKGKTEVNDVKEIKDVKDYKDAKIKIDIDRYRVKEGAKWPLRPRMIGFARNLPDIGASLLLSRGLMVCMAADCQYRPLRWRICQQRIGKTEKQLLWS